MVFNQVHLVLGWNLTHVCKSERYALDGVGEVPFQDHRVMGKEAAQTKRLANQLGLGQPRLARAVGSHVGPTHTSSRRFYSKVRTALKRTLPLTMASAGSWVLAVIKEKYLHRHTLTISLVCLLQRVLFDQAVNTLQLRELHGLLHVDGVTRGPGVDGEASLGLGGNVSVFEYSSIRLRATHRHCRVERNISRDCAHR